MTVPDCTRAWQAEALEDGRLSKADAASFQRHAATCELCRRQVEALTQLGSVARRLPTLTSTPLEHRRLRNELLRRAHESGTRTPSAPRRLWLAAGALALATATALLVWPSPAEPPPRAAPVDNVAPIYQVVARSDTAWRTLEHGSVLRLRLDHGQLDLSVAHLRADQRFLVELPDGELEVKGTRFVVQADGVRTQSVRVIEGRVVLRLRGQPALLLDMGDIFTAPTAEAAQPGASSPPPKPSRSKARAAPNTESTFSLAMAAFSAGDYGHADALFEQFEREQPRDTRVEDALFLRAIARARRGDESGARSIAREYLERFPSGLRRIDAERLAR